MQCLFDVENDPCLFLPRPWLEADAREVRDNGAMQLWTSGQSLYVKGLVGQTTLAYWHRAVPLSVPREQIVRG